MNQVNFKHLIHKTIKRMEPAGLNPYNQTFWKKYFARLLVIVQCFTFISQMFYIKFQSNLDIAGFIFELIGWSAMWQISMKNWASHFKSNIILSLSNHVLNDFWDYDNLQGDELKTISDIYLYTEIVSKLYNVSIFCTYYGFAIVAPFKRYHNLTWNLWMPESLRRNTPLYIFLLFFQFMLGSLATRNGLLQFDCLFLIFISSGVAQLKLLKYKLMTIGKSLENEQDFKTLIKCVEHHNLLFTYFQKIESVFSASVLHMLATVIILGVITLFGLLIADNLSDQIAYISVIISVALQFYMYCLLGQIILDETTAVADAAYSCNWEAIPESNIRMGIQMIIQRSHKPQFLTIGGFLILCLENFTRISRMMFSIFTLMLNMNE